MDSRVALLTELGIPAIATDLDGIIWHCNRPAGDLYGRDQDEMLGMAAGTIVLSPADGAIAISVVRELLRAGRWRGECEIQDATGSPLRLEVRATVVLDRGGQPVGVEAAFVDLRERVEAERRASESESRLRAVGRIAGSGSAKDMTDRVRTNERLQEAGEFWQGTLDSLTAQIALLDEHGSITAVNAAWRQFSQSEGGSDCVGSDYIAVCEASADPLATAVARALGEILAGRRDVFELEYPCHSPAAQRWFELRASRYQGPGALRVVVTREDITQRREAQANAFMHTSLLDEIDVSVIVTDSDLTVLSWNAGAERLYGWTATETIGRSATETILPLDSLLEADAEEFNLALARDGRWDGEYTVRRKDGSTFPAHVRSRALSGEDGHGIGTVSVAIDITEREEAEHALVSARNYLRAVTDSIGEGMYTLDSDGRLTYINQTAIDLLGWSSEELAGRDMHAMTHNRRADGSPLPVDECPILAARQDGTVVRVEDDLFIRHDGSQLPVAYTAAPFSTDDGIEGCVVVFEDITERKAAAQRVERDLEKLAWLERIREALSEERFVLYAQPIIDLKTGQTVQHELLLRMSDADAITGVIAPGSFLAVAEEFGLVTEIDRWVIDRSAEIAATGRPVQINISARSLSDPSIVDYIKQALERTGANPVGIVFEITETTLVSDEAAARAFVAALHLLGCKIALDDFGTGYGAFTYLKQLPIDFLKIDMEFVRDLRTNSASVLVVHAIVDLAKGFGLKTVGEGVEDVETLDQLRSLGVDYAQGFHIGRPAPIVTADQTLA